MVGPVLYLEMLLGGRRGRQMIFRYIYAGWLILQLTLSYFIYRTHAATSSMAFGGLADPNATSDFATGFVEVFVVQQLIIILLVTPAFAAGAITEEKTRGTLQYMLTAHLTAAEIVLGKLLGRMAQVGLLIIAGLPVLCFVGVWGGLHPPVMLAVFAVTIAPVFAIACASLLASVWCRQTRDAVLSLYGVFALAVLLMFVSLWLAGYLHNRLPAGSGPSTFLAFLDTLNAALNYFNPLFVLEPAWENGNVRLVWQRLIGSLLAWCAVGLPCLGLAVWRLRAAYIRQLESTGKRRGDGIIVRRAAVGDEPIRWKERQVEGIAPFPWLRWIPTWLGLLLVFFLTIASCSLVLWSSLQPNITNAAVWKALTSFDLLALGTMVDADQAVWKFRTQAIVAMLLASLIVGIRTSGTISSEREQQTWEALLLTPLETKQLIRGKLWGILGAAIPYLLAYAVPAVTLALAGGFPSVFWTVIWLAVTFLAMYYLGAAGLFASVRSRSSWRSMLGTLAFGYLGMFIIYVVTLPVIGLVALIIYLFLMMTDRVYNLGLTRAASVLGDFDTAFFIATCIGLALIFWLVSWYFVGDAEKRVADRERTRHWKEEPISRPRRRVAVPAGQFYK
ncbi:MAG: ABC transporter permease subunit [Planctomycetia bacterium]|nr:ABC transporter permease subunit [Planctomycetia bacterium]